MLSSLTGRVVHVGDGTEEEAVSASGIPVGLDFNSLEISLGTGLASDFATDLKISEVESLVFLSGE